MNEHTLTQLRSLRLDGMVRALEEQSGSTPASALGFEERLAKYSDHLPLYRQERIFGRAGVEIPRSTLAQWVGICGVRLQPLVDALKAEIFKHSVLHADETPVAMLKPGNKKTHKAYLWAYAPGAFEDLKAVVYDFCESRAGEHARTFLGKWTGSLVCDDYAGYKAGFIRGITEAGCMAHSRRKFFELHASSKSDIAGQAWAYISQLYDIEREIKTLKPEERLRIRQARSKPLATKFHEWMLLQRQRITDGTATAKALDYSLKRWTALTQFLDNGQLPIDNNWIENQIRPIAIGRNNANGSFMRTRLRRRAIPPSVEALTASLLLRMITATAGTASTPWAGGSEKP
jgi:hypothetical protein